MLNGQQHDIKEIDFIEFIKEEKSFKGQPDSSQYLNSYTFRVIASDGYLHF